MNKPKIKLGIYWAATCGGCDIAILRIDEKLLDLVAIADIVFWPVAMDFKYKDVEKMDDKSIDVLIFNGAIRNAENEHMAKLLRAKSKIVVAYGSCACEGCVIGLANLADKDEIFKTVYADTISTVNPEFTTPQTKLKVDDEELTLPEFYDTVKALHQVVDVDYYVPGCPPEPELTEKLVSVVADFVSTGKLPPKGTVIASQKSLCEECPRDQDKKSISKIYRFHEIIPDPKKCLLDQGIICMGPATRGGCGAKCIDANIPCTGCMGALPDVVDQGAAMLSALASIWETENEKELTDAEVQEMTDQIKDPIGVFYLYSLPVSLINRRVKEEKRGE